MYAEQIPFERLPVFSVQLQSIDILGDMRQFNIWLAVHTMDSETALRKQPGYHQLNY